MRRRQMILLSIIRIFQAYGHVGGKCPGDRNGLANEVGILEVRALRDIERVCVIDGDAHDCAELGGCAGNSKVAFSPSTTDELL